MHWVLKKLVYPVFQAAVDVQAYPMQSVLIAEENFIYLKPPPAFLALTIVNHAMS